MVEDSEVLTCKQCGAEYTMEEFRVWCYQHYSDLCIDCDVVRMKRLMRDKYGIPYPELDGEATE